MKNMTKSLCLAALCLGGTIAANVSYADVHCSGTTCVFTGLTKEENKNPFYCEVEGTPKPTAVVFENRDVLISGFNEQGKLVLNGDQVDQLAKYYFDAKKDNDSMGRMVISSVVGGKVSCHGDKGGRSEKWPGPYGK